MSINPKSKELSVGIVGAGDIVSKVHLPVLLNTKEISIEWITDINTLKAKSIANAYKIPFLKQEENINNLPYADIILIAIPYGAREPYYKILREHASALYVEKPFSRTVKEHKEICSWFSDYALCCGYQRRVWSPTQLTKKIIRDGLLGPLQSVHFELGNPGYSMSGKHYSDINLAGGGILFEVGVHGLDTLLYSTDAQSIEIKSAKMLMEGGFDIHTEADFIIKIKNNEKINCKIKISQLEQTTNKLEFVFNYATLSYSLISFDTDIRIESNKSSKNNLSLIVDSLNQTYPLTPYQTFSEYWNQFVVGIKTRQTNLTCAAESILTTEIIEELYATEKKLK
ncbi:MAG: hypothetical protein A3I68_06235 [Candidatus Melainabacteria bacterium RIFCSPLOWO2_02_FULL_35_15]|nr:MAG: hypothetical protein A3F80_08175 [Candidatus Melainabacteria bacterium RIFCSPLOWO2_12_FULL_35_11]OGI14564.1 MAG: hypothetical protein A3I68_06235 [Candidatus Melainabacteria bacterium RIFCSPLOWO2_02_FULL_35_15]